MQKFWQLFEQSIVTQAFITILLVFTVCFMWLTGKAIPSDLMQLTIWVIGFWMGSKTGFSAGVRKAAVELDRTVNNGG